MHERIRIDLVTLYPARTPAVIDPADSPDLSCPSLFLRSCVLVQEAESDAEPENPTAILGMLFVVPEGTYQLFTLSLI
jgi:hypothetical protein